MKFLKEEKEIEQFFQRYICDNSQGRKVVTCNSLPSIRTLLSGYLLSFNVCSCMDHKTGFAVKERACSENWKKTNKQTYRTHPFK